MTRDTHLRTYALPRLRERLVDVFGARKGYSDWVESEIVRLTGKTLGRAYVNTIVNGRCPASKMVQLTLVRIAEGDDGLTNVEAAALVGQWFELR